LHFAAIFDASVFFGLAVIVASFTGAKTLP
jgi:hypothetical protein